MATKDVLLNTKGAASQLDCSENWIHKLVQKGQLKAHVYNDEGVLVAREPNTAQQGRGLYFYEKDIAVYKVKKHRGRGRPTKKVKQKQREEVPV